METALIVRGGDRIATLTRRSAEVLALRQWIALRHVSRISRYEITSAGRKALRQHTRQTGQPRPRQARHDALTEADRDALAPYLDSDLSTREIARDLGWDVMRVYRIGDRFGLPIRARGKHAPFGTSRR